MNKDFWFCFGIVVGFIICMMLITCSCCWDDYKNESSKRECESTECTDSLCMRWDDSLKRCGIDSALLKERNNRDSVNQKPLLQVDSLNNIISNLPCFSKYAMLCNLPCFRVLGKQGTAMFIERKDPVACLFIKSLCKCCVK